MNDIEKLQNILKTKSTTFVRKIFDDYCKKLAFSKLDYEKKQEKWYYTQFDCKRRCRTICRLCDGEHELNIALRKKAGYYFLIEYDRHRIFECESEVIKLDEKSLNEVLEKYEGLFIDLFVESENTSSCKECGQKLDWSEDNE